MFINVSNFKCQVVLMSFFVHLFSSVSLDKLYTLSEIQLLHLYNGDPYEVIGRFKDLTCTHGTLPRYWYTEDSQPCTKAIYELHLTPCSKPYMQRVANPRLPYSPCHSFHIASSAERSSEIWTIEMY